MLNLPRRCVCTQRSLCFFLSVYTFLCVAFIVLTPTSQYVTDDELGFEVGDVIEVLERGTEDEPDWWTGRTTNGKRGLFPSNYVEEIPQKIGNKTAMPTQQSVLSEFELRDMDTDGDGKLDANELATGLKNHGMSSKEAVAIAADTLGDESADLDSSGELDAVANKLNALEQLKLALRGAEAARADAEARHTVSGWVQQNFVAENALAEIHGRRLSGRARA